MSGMDRLPELLSCPFCGDNHSTTTYTRDGRLVVCTSCGAKSGNYYHGPKDLPSADERAIAAWNRRAPQAAPAPSDALREAVAGAWNDAIEAADKAAIDRQGRRAMGDGHGNSCYDIGVSDAASAIRALRRAAPTEGEAQPLDASTRAVLDRAERIVAGQSKQEQRTAEIFLRPTEGEA